MKSVIQLPPGPKNSKISQLWKFIKKPIPLLNQCRDRYGKTFTLQFPNQPPYVVVSDPADIKLIFTSPTHQLHAGEMNGSILKPVLGDSSLLTLDGAKHLQHRKLILPTFHGERILFYGKIMSEITAAHIKSNWKQNQWITIAEEIRIITFNIIFRTIFGMEKTNIHSEKLDQYLQELLYTIKTPVGFLTLLNKALQVNLGPFTPWAKIIRLRNQVERILIAEIKERRQKNLNEASDIFSLLLQAHDEQSQPMTHQDITDELLTLLIAGHETTATGVSWAVYHILNSPRIYQNLITELEHHTVNNENVYTQINKLNYLDAIVKESLRIMPVVPNIVRLTKDDLKLNTLTLPKNVALVPSIYLAHHEESQWNNPKEFLPERFLNSVEKPYTFLPFGGGLRRCIGAAYAQHEIKILLAVIFSNVKLTLKKNYSPQLIRKGVVITPSKGVPVIVNSIKGN